MFIWKFPDLSVTPKGKFIEKKTLSFYLIFQGIIIYCTSFKSKCHKKTKPVQFQLMSQYNLGKQMEKGIM